MMVSQKLGRIILLINMDFNPKSRDEYYVYSNTVRKFNIKLLEEVIFYNVVFCFSNYPVVLYSM